MSRMYTDLMAKGSEGDRAVLLNILFEIQQGNARKELLLDSIIQIKNDIELLRHELVGERK